MKTCSCQSPSRASLLRRNAEAVGMLLSGAALVLMPKCPMCIAAYVTVISGASLSVSTASHLRSGLLILCSAILLALGAKVLFDLAFRKLSDDGRKRIVTPP